MKNDELLLKMGQLLMQAGGGPQVGLKHDLASGFTLGTNLMHGPGGIFGTAGLERDIFSTRVQPTGITSLLPAFGTTDMSPLFPYITGFTDDEDADEKDEVCDVPITPGEIKNCYQGAAFGRIERRTKPIDVSTIGETVNRGEFVDLRVVNDPLMESSLAVSSRIPKSLQQAINREVLSRMITMGASFEMWFAQKNWTGTPTNNTSGGYAEFWGLETLVGTGKVDVLTGVSCPSLNSDVRDMNYAKVATASATIFAHIVDMVRKQRSVSGRQGFGKVDWRFVMGRDLFHELVDFWPCTYATYRCDLSTIADTQSRSNVDAMTMQNMRDAMYEGMYLLVDGYQWPVVIDDGIPEDTAGENAQVDEGCFASDLYFLPFSVRGGVPVLYYQFFNYDADYNSAMMALRDAGMSGEIFISDGGRYLWTNQRTGWCFSLWSLIRPRLLLRTPSLAARLQNIQYCPITHDRQPFPDDAYFVDGGKTSRSNVPYDSSLLYQ